MRLADGMLLTPLGEMALRSDLDFGELYERYRAAVLRWSGYLAGPALDAEEIAQEVFLRAFRGRRAFRGEVSPSAWLYRITVEIVSAGQDRERRWERLATHLQGAGASPERNPLERLEQEQQRALIYQVLCGMRQRDRILLSAFVIEGLSGREIADLSGLKLSTVWTWLSRARADFRRRLLNRGLAQDRS